jgi:Zn finger protein HypA/HybF involved in hydrogenase expression
MILSFQLLEPQQQIILKKRLNEIEEMVLEDDMLKNYYQCEECGKRYKTRLDWFDNPPCPRCESTNLKIIAERKSFFDIELSIESNRDFSAFFMKYHKKVSKTEIEHRLNSVKQWIMSVVKEISSKRRFKRFR